MDPPATVQGKEYALQALAERREKAKEIGQIDNASLYAGSPMYYYCISCGLLADKLPEDWFIRPPKKLCEQCQALKDCGWLE